MEKTVLEKLNSLKSEELKSLTSTNKELLELIHEFEVSIINVGCKNLMNNKNHEPSTVELSEKPPTENSVAADVFSLNKHFEQLTSLQKTIDALHSSLDDKLTVIQNLLEKKEDRHGSVEHSNEADNVLTRTPSSKDVVLQWGLENYKHHRDIGVEKFSPVFRTANSKYCFQFSISWTGKKNRLGEIGLRLYLCRPKQQTGPLLPFDHEYTFALQRKKGGSEIQQVTFQDIEDNREKCFSIPEGKERSEEGYGKVFAPARHFIENNSISFKCTIHCL